jgi:hypothetical protein
MTKTINDAGNKKTCTAYQRSSVNEPSASPPRIKPATYSPIGPLRAILIVTVVAQYAF